MLGHSPRFTQHDARELARELYGLEGEARSLPSERDQNFRIDVHGGASVVLKIANALDDPELLGAQQRALTQLGHTTVPAPRVVLARDGSALAEARAADGRRHLVWMVSFLPGRPLAGVPHRPRALLEDFGRRIGALARGLQDFDHPAIHREFYWDLAEARRVIGGTRALVPDAEVGRAVDVVVARVERDVAPVLPSLRKSAIHGDLNDHNVLVSGHAAEEGARALRISGIVDFGDMVHGWTIGDLAIAAAYVSLAAPDPLASMAALVRGCHAEFPLEEPELSALFGLVLLRLAQSACIAAHQRRQRPGDAYLDVSQEPIRRALPRLAKIPFGLAEAVFRDACGLEPVASSARVQRWLADRTTSFAPVIADVDLREESTLVLDLSVASPLVSGADGIVTTAELTSRVFSAMEDAGVRVATGRYDEPRLLYAADFFSRPDAPGVERRTIHIGLDLFAPAGTPVHAPLAGRVHAFADNHLEQDYGPVIILRHSAEDDPPRAGSPATPRPAQGAGSPAHAETRTPAATEFFTLYGHLSRESLAGMHVGREIARGERFATLGAEHENVGWTPHLHLQIITDLLDLGTDFPGVGAASQRDVWRSLSPDPNLLVGITAHRFPRPGPTLEAHRAWRADRLGRNLSVAYRSPLRVARGWMQYLFDEEGRRYLDAYNNVPHVGHCHPRVVAAGQAQMSVLATNTRYLHDLLTRYADRLSASLPESLTVAYLVNSASEANELALRLARAYTGRRDTIVLEAAYHGNTTSLIDISPYKHAGPGGAGAPDWVHVVPLPDDYRGVHRRDDPDAGAKYARHVAELCAELGSRCRAPAAFIAESCPSVAGQIMLPPGYLRDVYASVRGAGGVCIADEVQTGLGRIGTHFWAFESQSVVPDIVVMGKPLGNGHPIGAVVTTREVADAFANGMEYFSTFGGNTVSCAIGLAVLDVIRDECLQAQALFVGERLLGGLRALGERHALVGDVRGSGLFIGVELVGDRATRAPAPREAAHVVERMREEGILLGTDGPYHNVIKIRPPMPFDEADAERLVATMDRVLGELA